MKLGSIVLVLSAVPGSVVSAGHNPALEVSVPIVSAPVESGTHTMLAFEIHLANRSGQSLRLVEVAILDADRRVTLESYAGNSLNARLHVSEPASGAAGLLEPGAGAVVYVEPAVDHAVLTHIAVCLQYVDAAGVAHTLRTPPAVVDPRPVPILAPPLGTGVWVAVHDPGWERGHRRMIYTISGQPRIPGRYAVDWVGVDARGRTSRGAADRPADAVGYGAPVLAGADAVVSAVRGDMAESDSISRNLAQPVGSGSGNFVVLQLGPQRFAFYEHLKPGSVTLKVGDRVQAGRVLGALGFTGDSTGPHLHLHVADCNRPLECEGVPFRIRGMQELGRYAPLSDLGTQVWDGRHPRGHLRPEWPDDNVVVQFRR